MRLWRMRVAMSFQVFRTLIARLAEKLPSRYLDGKLDAYLIDQSDEAIGRAMERVHYYHRTDRKFAAWHAEMGGWPKPSCPYRNDFRPYRRYFAAQSKISYRVEAESVPGDCPTILKSRSIHAANEKAILFKFNADGEYPRIHDARRFADKRPLAIVVDQRRGSPHQRVDQDADSTVGIGRLIQGGVQQGPHRPVRSLKQVLEYKYILFHQDAASGCNPKWILSSQSLCMMPRPAYETWLMEGCLRPNYHFVPVKQDLSDLEEKISYYNDHPFEAEAIIENARFYAERFDDAQSERLVTLLVLVKYFVLSGQIDISERIKSLLLA